MSGRKLLIIVDGGSGHDLVAEWQRRALASLPAADRLTLLICNNTKLARKALKFPLYYALNLFAVRNRLTRLVQIGPLSAKVEQRIEFSSLPDGGWQMLPPDIISYIATSGADAVIKLGMGLMRVPPHLTIPILSWHHGDPEQFRGRPAGFWELMRGSEMIGQMVQIISNRLDAGAVVAYAETRVIDHSWRDTLVEAFRHSPLLLEIALANVASGTRIPKLATGVNYRLPSNFAVIRLVGKLAWAKCRRLLYGAFFEKEWRVSRALLRDRLLAQSLAVGKENLPEEAEWWTPPVPPGCTFIADCFYAGRDAILVEALSRTSGKGEIHLIDQSGSKRLSQGRGHHSYPALVEHDDEMLCVPETAQWQTPTVFRWFSGWEELGPLSIAGNPRLLDPSFLRYGGRLYLFANVASEGSMVLRLWSADSLFSEFEEHPASPIRISPRGSRMAGMPFTSESGLIRIGQDFARDYGNGLVVFSVDELSRDSYSEHEIGAWRFQDRKGPHTFNLAPDGKSVLFDWYRDRFSPLAGFRRALNRYGGWRRRENL